MSLWRGVGGNFFLLKSLGGKKNPISHPGNASRKKYRCYYPHRLRDLVSPICRIFLLAFYMVPFFIVFLNSCYLYQLFYGCCFFCTLIKYGLEGQEDTARYAGILLATEECYGLQPRLILLFLKKHGF